jgi:hypothetical protein
MDDPHAIPRDRAFDSVTKGPAQTDSSLRTAAAANQKLPVDLQRLVSKIHAHAYRVTDEDVAAAKVKYGDDRMFEIIVSSALGASRERLLAGLAALDEA